jgi:PASTA domain/WD40-like Beta Propeller Repeat
MTTDELLRDALRTDAERDPAPAPAAAGWDGVRTRGAQIRRRRRGAQGAVALVSILAVAAGVLALAGTFAGGGGGTRRGVVATPPGGVSDQIVVDRGDRIEVISATDGHVLRTLVSGIDSNPGGVSVTPDGTAVVYTRKSPAPRCGTELVEQPLDGGAERVIVGHSWNPLVSPDGQWVAYVTDDSCESGRPSAGAFLGLTGLRTGLNYRPYEQELGDHPAKLDLLAWSPDSTRLVYDEQRSFPDGSDQKTFEFSEPPLAKGAAQQEITVAGPVGGAAFLSDDRLVVSRGNGRRYEVLVTDFVSGRALRSRYAADGPTPSALALDPSGRRLLVTEPDGTLLVQEGVSDPRPIAHGAHGAAWLPAAKSTASSLTTPAVVGLSQADATQILTQLGFSVTILYTPGPTSVDANRVVSQQSIAPGSSVPPGTVVAITVGPIAVNASP